MKIHLNSKDALIIVDVQADFLPGGALAVAGADKVISPLNHYIQSFSKAGLPIFFTRDWHPEKHLSFRENGGAWPRHCEADTPGALFPQELYLPTDNKFIVSKGVKQEFDAYSGFQDTVLSALLQERGIRRVFIGGLATEYCVKNTVMGALNLGYATILLSDAIQGVGLHPGDCEKALEQMLDGGAVAVTISECIVQEGKPTGSSETVKG